MKLIDGFGVIAALAAAALAVPAQAALGERADSIAADEAALAAARGQADARSAFRVERLDSAARTVREYVAPSGVVFAVTWEGLSPPDLSAVLGAYAEPVRRALAQGGGQGGRRAHRIEAEGAVVETWGHMRALRGRAYVPALVPAGVALDEIR
jgi:hypothetical protein